MIHKKVKQEDDKATTILRQTIWVNKNLRYKVTHLYNKVAVSTQVTSMNKRSDASAEEKERNMGKEASKMHKISKAIKIKQIHATTT